VNEKSVKRNEMKFEEKNYKAFVNEKIVVLIDSIFPCDDTIS